MTLVKFLKHPLDNEVFAFFPQINYNERLYGSTQKESYSTDGKSACSSDYAQQCNYATALEYKDLLNELVSSGYSDLKVENESFLQRQYEASYEVVYNKFMKEHKDFDIFTQKLDAWVINNAPKYGVAI